VARREPQRLLDQLQRQPRVLRLRRSPGRRRESPGGFVGIHSLREVGPRADGREVGQVRLDRVRGEAEGLLGSVRAEEEVDQGSPLAGHPLRVAQLFQQLDEVEPDVHGEGIELSRPDQAVPGELRLSGLLSLRRHLEEGGGGVGMAARDGVGVGQALPGAQIRRRHLDDAGQHVGVGLDVRESAHVLQRPVLAARAPVGVGQTRPDVVAPRVQAQDGLADLLEEPVPDVGGASRVDELDRPEQLGERLRGVVQLLQEVPSPRGDLRGGRGDQAGLRQAGERLGMASRVGVGPGRGHQERDRLLGALLLGQQRSQLIEQLRSAAAQADDLEQALETPRGVGARAPEVGETSQHLGGAVDVTVREVDVLELLDRLPVTREERQDLLVAEASFLGMTPLHRPAGAGGVGFHRLLALVDHLVDAADGLGAREGRLADLLGPQEQAQALVESTRPAEVDRQALQGLGVESVQMAARAEEVDRAPDLVRREVRRGGDLADVPLAVRQLQDLQQIRLELLGGRGVLGRPEDDVVREVDVLEDGRVVPVLGNADDRVVERDARLRPLAVLVVSLGVRRPLVPLVGEAVGADQAEEHGDQVIAEDAPLRLAVELQVLLDQAREADVLAASACGGAGSSSRRPPRSRGRPRGGRSPDPRDPSSSRRPRGRSRRGAPRSGRGIPTSPRGRPSAASEYTPGSRGRTGCRRIRP
jgi:hypothetical protein